MRALVIQPLSLLPVKQGGKNGWALPDCRGRYWLIHVKNQFTKTEVRVKSPKKICIKLVQRWITIFGQNKTPKRLNKGVTNTWYFLQFRRSRYSIQVFKIGTQKVPVRSLSPVLKSTHNIMSPFLILQTTMNVNWTKISVVQTLFVQTLRDLTNATAKLATRVQMMVEKNVSVTFC